MIRLFFLMFSFLFAYSDIYIFGIKLNYKEYENSKVIDKDYSSFKDLVGIGGVYEKKYYFFRGEFAYGSSYYDGSTWSGVPVKNRQYGVYIFDVVGGVGIGNLRFILGYREWNRGKSNYVGDYDEVYYWAYWGIRYKYSFSFSKIKFLPEVSYKVAINPKMKVVYGNNPVLYLGDTDGGSIELPFVFSKDNLNIKVFYRFEYWHINKSLPALLVTKNSTYTIYEPESLTQNQYIGVGVVYKF